MACESSDTSLNEFTDDNLSFLEMELETLQSIFVNELEVKEDENFTTVSIDLNPSTADKLDEQYVRMTLQLILDEEYPEKIPEIKIRNPRGLSDDELNSITQDLLMIAESKKGNSMLFEMIDAAKEHLTVGNRPSGECAICLHGFSDNDVFTKTECYHYFHSHCLARYAKNFFENPKNNEEDAESKVKSDELLCPMCRIPIEFDDWDMDYPPPEESYESNFTLSEEMIELQKKMAALFQKQVQKGAIIDIEAEKNKYLLEISNVSSRADNEEKSDQKSAAEGGSVIDSKTEQSDGMNSPAPDEKDYVKDSSRRFDNRGRNRNFNRPFDNRSNNRYNHRYGKQSFNRENYNKFRHGRQSSENSYQNESDFSQKHGRQSSENSYQNESDFSQKFETKGSSITQDLTENEDLINSSPDAVESNNVSESLENTLPNSKARYNPNFSPRYKNRGYHHGRNNYDSRRSGKSGFNEQRNSEISHRYSAQRAEDSSNKFEKRFENDVRTQDEDYYKSDYKSGLDRHDSGYAKQRYNDGRNNSHNSFKGAYNRRDAYSNSYNSRNNRYTDSKDRDQYTEKSYRENRYATYKDRDQYPERNYRENRFANSKDRDQHSERNHRENRYADFRGRDQHSERNYRENRYTDSKNKDQYAERDYKENKYSDSKDGDKYSEKNHRENRYAASKDWDQNPDRNYKGNKYTDSRDRYQYPNKNYRDKQAYRDVKYENNEDIAHNRSRQGTRNYSGSRPERYSDRSSAEPFNNKSESLELNSQNQNGDTLTAENSSSNLPSSSSQKEKSLPKKESTDSKEKSSNVVPAFNSNSSNILPNAFCENSDAASRTVNPPPGFANPLKKVVYGLQGANPPPGFNRS